jgi:hypothetical protein
MAMTLHGVYRIHAFRVSLRVLPVSSSNCRESADPGFDGLAMAASRKVRKSAGPQLAWQAQRRVRSLHFRQARSPAVSSIAPALRPFDSMGPLVSRAFLSMSELAGPADQQNSRFYRASGGPPWVLSFLLLRFLEFNIAEPPAFILSVRLVFQGATPPSCEEAPLRSVD